MLLAGGGDISEPCFVFNKVPEAKIVKNRLHLNLVSDTFDAETERLLSLGARKLSDRQSWRVSADDLRRHRRQRV